MPSNSHLLEVARSIKAIPSLHDIPRDYLLDYLNHGEFDWKDMGLVWYNPSW